MAGGPVPVTTAQMAALVLAMSEGYVRPESATHARRCNTSTGRLFETCKTLCRTDPPLMKAISGGRYQATDAGHEHVPSTPVRRRFDGTEYVEF